MKAEPMAMTAGSARRTSTSAWPALLFTAIVAIAATYAFSPRPMPPFAPTAVHPDGLLVNGLAQQGPRLIAVGEQGQILIADDIRGPWRSAPVDPQRGSTLTQVRFIGDRIALAVGHDGWILRSTDSGETWKESFFIDTPKNDDASSAPADGVLAPPPDASTSAEPPPDASSSAEPPADDTAMAADDSAAAAPLMPDPLLGIAGPFDGRVFAVGGFGLMLMSDDAGQSWQRVVSDAIGDHHLSAMLRAADGALILVGERGLLLRSTDRGQTWQALPQIYDGSFFGALALPSKSLLIFGMRGNVFRSDDNGKTWHKSEVPHDVSLFGGSVTSTGEVTLVGAASTVLVSTDDGRSFTQKLSGDPHDYAAVLPVSENHWLVAGDGGLKLVAADAAAAATGVAK